MAKSTVKKGKAPLKTTKGKVADAGKAVKVTRAKSTTKATSRVKTAKTSASAHDYIIGYGSLIEFASRTRTAKDALYVRPVKVMGYVRGWFAQVQTAGYSPTYVGAVLAEKLKARPRYPYLNGVVYFVTKEELAATDQREDAGYERVAVDPRAITMLDGGGDAPAGNYWIYLNKFTGKDRLEQHIPSSKFPIVQSYVDICINGCLEIEANFPASLGFVEMFIQTTQFWSNYWVNDRPMPRRPFMERSNAYTIDTILAKALPSFFETIEIEPASWEK